jgi:16S rRNA (guanine(966)-N(2))-methyltransferase RsmD
VRIIGGQWRLTRLKVLEKPGLRSTPDRVRETMFNWLGQDLSCWRCVDAFAGTGVLGLEAVSRAAVHVLMVEQDAVLVRDLQENATRQTTKHGVTTGLPSASSGLAQVAL